jgi:two-component system, NtrC family, nitrogen regulation sensor histidine kinase NtrY
MIVKRQSVRLVWKLLVFSLTTAALMYVLLFDCSIILLVLLGLALLAEVFDFVHFFNAQNRKLSYFFEAIRNEDTSLLFPEKVTDRSLKVLYKGMNDLNRMISEIKIRNETNERFFRELIEHSSTGLMTLDHRGYVEVINSTAKKYLGVVQLTNINLLKQKNQLLYDAITLMKPGEKKIIQTMVAMEPVSLSLQCSELRFGDDSFQLISLQDIGHELEENEIDSWQKLIRVMTHEIMNSIAPITSLTNTLLRFFHQGERPKMPEELTDADISNTIEGLSVIEERGKGLIHFVDNYRQLAKVPKPIFAPLEVKPWVRGLGLLFQPELQRRSIQFEFSLDPSITTLMTDEKLLNQVMINLMTNAIDALDTISEKQTAKIQLSVRATSSDGIHIELYDNGCGIDESLMDKIFVPFFTTKEGGNGIGLSLSRQIVRKLNGKLTVQSAVGQGCRFVVAI